MLIPASEKAKSDTISAYCNAANEKCIWPTDCAVQLLDYIRTVFDICTKHPAQSKQTIHWSKGDLNEMNL